MKPSKPSRWQLKKQNFLFGCRACGAKMKQLPLMAAVCGVIFFIAYRITNYQHQLAEIESDMRNSFTSKVIADSNVAISSLSSLPRGIINEKSDLELRPLWTKSSSMSKVNETLNRPYLVITYLDNVSTPKNLLAMSVGIKQKENVNAVVQKFVSENFTIILFHYDGNVDAWWDLEWSREAIHIVAHNQTKWWFAKRFLHPAIVSIYDYIFLWDEDLEVNFHPRRYLEIVKSEGFQVSQPALDPNSTGIHHKITIRRRTNKFHRRVYDARGSVRCSSESEGPPCTGFVEGMAPVFSRLAWHCAWHLIQNDLIHGWGVDMKLGYCAQGNRTKNVGVVDREYVVHQSIQTLGGKSDEKEHGIDVRSEIRRESTKELGRFKERWEEAVKMDRDWVDPFPPTRRS